jgi:hypothetical protein
MEERLIKGFEKLINSDIIKDVYPMIDHIDITSLDEHPLYAGNIMSIRIYLNDPSINKDNMFDLDFDPHWLTDYYINDFSKYLGLNLVNIAFSVYGPDDNLITYWD